MGKRKRPVDGVNPAVRKLGERFSVKALKDHALEAARFRAAVKRLIQEAAGTSPEIFALKFSGIISRGLMRSYNLGREAVRKKRTRVRAGSMAATTLAGQLKYMYRFAQDIKSGQGRMPYTKRGAMYASQMDAAFLRGAVEALDADDVVHWVLHPAEHCEDCVALAEGSPYTVATLPTVPGAGETRCLSNCKCTLEFHPKVPSRREFPSPTGPGTRTSAGFTHGRVNKGFQETEMQQKGIRGSWYERIHSALAVSPGALSVSRRKPKEVRKAVDEVYPHHSQVMEWWSEHPGSDLEDYYRQAAGRMYGGSYREELVGRSLTPADLEALETLGAHGLSQENYVIISVEKSQFLVPADYVGRQWVSKEGGPFEPAGTVESYLHDMHLVNASMQGLGSKSLYRPVERGTVKAGDTVEMSSMSSFTEDRATARMSGKAVIRVDVPTTKALLSPDTGLHNGEHVLLGGSVRVAKVEEPA